MGITRPRPDGGVIKGIKSVMLLPLSSQVKDEKVIFAAKRIKRSLFQPRKGSCGKTYFKILLPLAHARFSSRKYNPVQSSFHCNYFEES